MGEDMKKKELDFVRLLLKECKYKPYISGKAFEFSGDNQLMYYLDKWTIKNWWEYGVSLRTGWFTPEGIEHFKNILDE